MAANPAASFDRRKTKIAGLRKASYTCWELAVLTWVWYELWLPLALATVGVVQGSLPPLWALAILLAVFRSNHLRSDMRKNMRDTVARLIVVRSRFESLRFSLLPRVEEVELGPFVGWGKAVKLLLNTKGSAIPFYWVELVVRPPDSAGDPALAKRYEDFLRRRLRFTHVEHEVNPVDPNTYIYRLEMATPVKRVDAERGNLHVVQ